MPISDEGKELELRDYLRVIRRRKLVIIFTTAVAVATALAWSYAQTPVYEATAEVLVQQRAPEDIFDESSQSVDAQRRIDTEIRVLESRTVEEAVRDELGHVPDLSGSSEGETDVISVNVRSTNREQAARDANVVAETYIQVRRQQAIDDLLAAGNEIQARINDLQGDIDALPLADPDRQRLADQQAFYRQQLEQFLLAANIAETGGGQLVSRAETPESPVEPKPVRNGALALALGLLLGVGLAFLRDYLDDTVRAMADVAQASDGLPVIGVIPKVSGWKDRREPLVVSLAEPTSPASEAYRTLRTSIQFLSLDTPTRVVQITSAAKEEGKTATAANLAVTFAQTGMRVVLIDCDLRRPRLHDFFGLSHAVGYTSVLLGTCSLSDALRSAPSVSGLHVLASGPVPPDPAELLASRRTAEVIEAAQARCDLLLVDSPPVLPVSDALILSGLADKTLLVANAGQTTKRTLQRAVELLRQVDAPLGGTVLNGASGEGAYGYGYTQRYYRRRPGSETARSTARSGDESSPNVRTLSP